MTTSSFHPPPSVIASHVETSTTFGQGAIAAANNANAARGRPVPA